MAKGNRNDRQTISDNGCWRGGVERQEFKCKTEDPTGYFFILGLSIFCLGFLNQMLCEWNKFLIRWPVVGPHHTPGVPVPVDESMEVHHCEIEWKAPEIGKEGENPAITPAKVC